MADKVLITGGAGFIGSHLAEWFKQQGRAIVLVDDLSTGRRENIAPLLDRDCQLIEGRASAVLRDPAVLVGVSEIYHLAAAVGVKLVVDQPAEMVRNNIDETHAVLDAARQANAAVLIASSSEVYGKCPTLPLREDMELVYGPTTASRWSYGLTKALDEHLALDYHRRYGLGVIITRLFNTIGPRQLGRYGMVVPRFVSSAVRNQPIQVYGDGRQTRAFSDARDIVRAMADLLGKPACHGQVYNLGSDRQITIRQLAEMVIDLAGSTGGVREVPYEAVYGQNFEDPPQRLPALDRIRNAIGFKPRYTLEQTLTELIEREQQSLAITSGTASDACE
ncbi:NAD-dependent epimerase/dehydratase family protein [Phycisphaerales bacterium AB-hyl4]|uniref:NAD-dependent epimerase/dehydratase family protein n=1 Tax=Natronomicrosphaera hydrolytica TaxID=3242702 RepID=A0ABV4TZJ3_9BACT